MNRFFTLLLAASCLTAVGQEDCLNVLACNYGVSEPCVLPEVGRDCFGDCAGGSPASIGPLLSGPLFPWDDDYEPSWHIGLSFTNDLWSYVYPVLEFHDYFLNGDYWETYSGLVPGLEILIDGVPQSYVDHVHWSGSDGAWYLGIQFDYNNFDYALCDLNEVTIELHFSGGGCEKSFTTTQPITVPNENQGCTDSLALNYNPNSVCYQDDWLYCTYPEGCMDPSACNFDPDAIYDFDAECEYFWCIGCTDPNACNYSTSATIDDNSCLTFDVIGVCGGSCLADLNGNGVCDSDEVYGCTYYLANNFNNEATDDDGSCVFPCEGDLNSNVFDWDGDYAVTVSDFLMMLSVYGDVDLDADGVWDSTDDCVGEYDECGVCNGPGPQIAIVEDVFVSYDSVYVDQIGEWIVYEAGVDTIFSYICEPVVVGDCGNPVVFQGYEYSTVLVGEQCWFAENLRNENYANGDLIPSNLTNQQWASTAIGAVCVYGESEPCTSLSADFDACNESLALNEYGRLYNWHAVDDSRSLCPVGWHVADNGEWTELVDNLGGANSAGLALKSTTGWNTNNGNNTSGLDMRPGGYRRLTGGSSALWTEFDQAGGSCKWWTSSNSSSTTAYAWQIFSDYSVYGASGVNKRIGGYVRCIKD